MGWQPCQLSVHLVGHLQYRTFSTWHIRRHGRSSDLKFLTLTEAPFETILPMMIGWVPVGLVLGFATYYPSLWTVQAYQRLNVAARWQEKPRHKPKKC